MSFRFGARNAVSLGPFAASTLQQSNAIAIGAHAGRHNQGAHSIAIGANAGHSNQHQSTIVMNATGIAINTLQDNSSYMAPVRFATAANLMTYNSTTKEVTYSDHLSGSLGIGTTTVSAKLHTYGDAIIADSALYKQATATVMKSNGSASLAIVAGGESYSAILYLGTPHAPNLTDGSNSAYKVAILANGNGSGTGWSTADLHFCVNDATGSGTNSYTQTASISHSKMVIKTNGRVGIGLTNPDYKLHVSGDSFSSGNVIGSSHIVASSVVTYNNTADKGKWFKIATLPSRGVATFGVSWSVAGEHGYILLSCGQQFNSTPFIRIIEGNYYGHHIPQRFRLATDNASIYNDAYLEMYLVDTSWYETNIPITVWIVNKPPVNSSVTLFSAKTDATTTGFTYYQVYGYHPIDTNWNGARFCMANTGRVGIGTNDPGTTLDVVGVIRAYGNGSNAPASIYAQNASSSSDAYTTIFLRNDSSSSGCYWFMNSSTRTVDGGSNTATLRNDVGSLRLQSAGGVNSIFIKATSGNVGFRTEDPTAPLHIKSSGGSNPSTNGIYVYNDSNSAGQDSIISIRTGGSSAGDAYTSYDISSEYGWSSGLCNADNSYRINKSWSSLTSDVHTVFTNIGQLDLKGGSGGGTWGREYCTAAGTLIIGRGDTNYGGSANNRAGFLMECLDTTEMAIHDRDTRIVSCFYYNGANRLYIGRDCGWGSTPVECPHSLLGNEMYTNNWFRINGGGGVYWESYSKGIWSPESAGNSYGNIATYGGGRNGWMGYGIGSRHCVMGNNSEVGIHDNNNSWCIYFDGSRNGTVYSTFTMSGNGRVYGTFDVGGTDNLRLESFTEYRRIQSFAGKPLAINPLGNNVGIGITNPSAVFELKNPNQSVTHFGHTDNINYIRGRTIFDTGYVEIGASYVWRAPLDITTSVGRDNGGVRYFDVWGGLGYTSNWYSYSAMADTWGGSRFMAYSDVRKKKNIKPVENVLENINKLNIVSYDHIDATQPHNYFGCIAQEIDKDYPHMINKGYDFLPNIYEKAIVHKCSSCGQFVNITLSSEIDPKHIGKKLKIVTYDVEKNIEYDEVTEIVSVEGNTIKVKIWKKLNEIQYESKELILVYGTYEDDVMTLDKSQFGFMAIKGIQELSKENDSLKNVIESQTQKINQLEETIKQHTILLAQLMTK